MKLTKEFGRMLPDTSEGSREKRTFQNNLGKCFGRQVYNIISLFIFVRRVKQVRSAMPIWSVCLEVRAASTSCCLSMQGDFFTNTYLLVQATYDQLFFAFYLCCAAS